MTLDFRINGQHLSLIGNPFVVAESYDFLEASFAFSDDWADAPTRKAYFQLGTATPYEVPIAQDPVTLEWAIANTAHINLPTGTWKIWVAGYDSNGDELIQRIPTNDIELYVRPALGFTGGIFPEEYRIAALLQLDQTTEQTLTGGVPKLSATRTISNANHLADKKYVDDVADTLLSLDQTVPQELTDPPLLASDRVIESANQMVDKQYVDQYALGGSGFAANLYFTTIASNVATYKKISYIAEAVETELPIAATTVEALARTYLYDDGLGVTVIDGGKWSATYRARVSSAQGAVIRLVAFLRHTDNSETELFSAISDKIVNTTYQTLEFQITQPSFGCLATDRLGFRLYVSTTHPAGVTLYTVVGDGNASYVNTPIALRHSQLRDKNGEADVQHMTAAQISALHSHANKTALDAVRGTNTGDQDVSGAISAHNDDTGAHADKESKSNKSNVLSEASTETEYPSAKAAYNNDQLNNGYLVCDVTLNEDVAEWSITQDADLKNLNLKDVYVWIDSVGIGSDSTGSLYYAINDDETLRYLVSGIASAGAHRYSEIRAHAIGGFILTDGSTGTTSYFNISGQTILAAHYLQSGNAITKISLTPTTASPAFRLRAGSRIVVLGVKKI